MMIKRSQSCCFQSAAGTGDGADAGSTFTRGMQGTSYGVGSPYGRCIG